MNPTFLADQLGAACSEAQKVIDYAGAVLPGSQRIDGPPGPFAGGLLGDALERALLGQLKRCNHLRRGPGVGWLLAWSPERVRCRDCVAIALRGVRGTVEDTVCDVCRQAAPQLRTVIGAAGPVVIVFGACGDCYLAETAVAA